MLYHVINKSGNRLPCVLFALETGPPQPVLLFSKLKRIFFRYIAPGNFFFKIMKSSNFRCDLTDISSKIKPLTATVVALFRQVPYDR